MITRRKLLASLGFSALAPSFPLFAQHGKVARIGILSARSRSTAENPDIYFDGFLRGMRELGYVEGRNLAIEWRYADGKYERLPALAAELVQLKPDVIVTHTTPGVQALQPLTKTIPIVMTSISDPVGSGFAASLARPGGNITGMSLITVDVSPKQLELLAIMVPRLSRVGVLVNPGTTFHAVVLKSIQAAAKARGMEVLPVQAGSLEEIEAAFSKLAKEGIKAVILPTDSQWNFYRRQLTEITIRHRMATMNLASDLVAAGGLMSYGTNIPDSYRRAATYVDKILKGAKPSDLPIEQPNAFHLAINRKTAKALGLKIPQELIGRADEVID